MKIDTGWVVGIIAFVLVCILITYREPANQQIGYTSQELKEMKAECEKDLSRSTECSIVVYYLPQAEQLEEVE